MRITGDPDNQRPDKRSSTVRGKYTYVMVRTPVPVAARSAVARLLRLLGRISPGAWTFVCCECRVLSGRGLCDGLIILPGESYRP